MSDVFLRVCNVALTAGWVALLIMAARLLLRRAPRRLTCLLWGVVGLRLLLPFSFQSFFSLIPSAKPIPESIVFSPTPGIDSGFAAVDQAVNPVLSATLSPAAGEHITPVQRLLSVGAWIWLVGVAAMLIWAAISYLRIRRQVRVSLLLHKGVYLCDDINTPFILGVVRPRIYLPSSLSADATECVIAHERAHLRRLDHIIKPLGFVLLSVYWFQPLLWVAYVWLCRDIEAACDERVIREMDGDDRKRYSEALLSCSVRGRMISACPLAFGEVGVKERVRAVLNYKKPAFWLILVAVVLSIVLAIGLISDPWRYPSELLRQTDTSWSDEDGILELTVHENFEILGTLKIGDVERDVRMLYRERYAEICPADDPGGEYPLLKCGLRVRGDKLLLLISDDMAQTGIEELLLSQVSRGSAFAGEVNTAYEGIYLTIDNIVQDQNGSLTLHASWHNDTDAVEAIYGEPYAIDYWDGSAWVDLTPENLVFELPGYMLNPGEVKQKTYSTAHFNLPCAGRYRLRSSFSIENLPYREWVETSNQYETWAEFYVSDAAMQEQTNANALLSKVKQAHPEYFDLDTSNGLTVYAWRLSAGYYSCGLLPGQPDDHTQTQLLQLKGTTIEEMKAVLGTYAVSHHQIAVKYVTMGYSSYYEGQTDKEAQAQHVRSLLGLDDYTPIIYGVRFDLNGDGKQEHITISAGPTSGQFSFRLTVQDAESGRQLYNGVFYSSAMDLHFQVTDDKLYLCGTELHSGAKHTYDVTLQNGVVSITEGGVPIGGEMDPDSVPGSADAGKGENWVVEPTEIVFPTSEEAHRYLEPMIVQTYSIENDSPWGRYFYHRVSKKCHDCGEVIESVEAYLCQRNNSLCQGGCLSGW